MSEFTEVKDSGTRQEFPTGSKRDTRSGKGRFDLISPIFEERLAKHLENGAVKYGDRNWELGQPLMRYIDSAKRHINKYQQGLRDEDHLTAAAWNLMAFVHTEQKINDGVLPRTLDDRPKNDKEPKPSTVVRGSYPKFFMDTDDGTLFNFQSESSALMCVMDNTGENDPLEASWDNGVEQTKKCFPLIELGEEAFWNLRKAVSI